MIQIFLRSNLKLANSTTPSNRVLLPLLVFFFLQKHRISVGAPHQAEMPNELPAMNCHRGQSSPCKGLAFTVGLVTSWYFSNIGVLLLNKFLLSNYGFKYPIFLTTCHMAACSVLSYIALVWFRVAPVQMVKSGVQFCKIAALSFVFCGSVVSGNISLRFLPVSFNKAVGATTPFFTAVFAFIMTAKREAWATYATLVPVVTGVVVASGVGL
jgi:Triose-phosphate Transporter family